MDISIGWQRVVRCPGALLNKQSGFTLLEIVIALAVSSLLLVITYQSIDDALMVKTSLNEKMESSKKLTRTLWLIERDVFQAAPRAITDELGSEMPPFIYSGGQGLELTVAQQGFSIYSAGGFSRIKYNLDDGDLIRSIWTVLDRSNTSKPKKLVLMKEVKSFDVFLNERFEYWPVNEGMIPRTVKVLIEKENGEVFEKTMIAGGGDWSK